jgi:hypothetical protein
MIAGFWSADPDPDGSALIHVKDWDRRLANFGQDPDKSFKKYRHWIPDPQH